MTAGQGVDHEVHEINSASDLTLDLVSAVADGAEVRLGDAALRRIAERRKQFLQFVDQNSDQRLYGVTTRHHTAAKTVMGEVERAEYAARLPSTPAAFGDPLPERLTRGILLARLADVLNGTACLRADTAVRLIEMLNEDLPPVPGRGHGEPGDIIALSHLFRADFDGTLELGEGMAMINGSPVAAAVLCDVALSGRPRLGASELVLALSAAAVGAPDAHYSEALETVWNDEFQASGVRHLRELLAGRNPEDLRAYQAPVSFRSAPRVLGWLVRAQSWVEECAGTALAASSNNPIFVGPEVAPPSGALLSNGGYHNALAAPAVDVLVRAWADLCQIVSAQLNQLVELPDGLRVLESEPQISLLYMSSAGCAEEARTAATPTFTSIAAGGQTDTGTQDLAAWAKAESVGLALDQNLALLGVVAVHTLARQDKAVPPRLRRLHDQVLRDFPLGAPPVRYKQLLEDVQSTLRSTSSASQGA
ncbi:aromatic amino acid lyase [Nocardioides pocheonensis]|uniref:Histidine ammonia-lyase n=1 Tax=Nocardioides pocheonensis TaxID=661485 RepID=A0A3N0GIU1_9ACTN|nr:aromatic amino acid lyase [Nocardioides pocheonensis]RNM12092.1 histidine ammonia-lyase [Nocardioides pocheonensis]